MYDRIERFVSLIWDAVRYAFYGDWDAFGRKMDDIRGWWEGMVDDIWGSINYAKDIVVDWATKQFNSILDWINWASGEFGRVWNNISAKFNEATHYAYDLVVAAYNYVDQWVDWLGNEIGKVDDWFRDVYYSWIIPSFNSVIANINSLWDEVFTSLRWWKDWLYTVYQGVNWYVDTAFHGLSLFLADPVGFVLGIYKDMFGFWLVEIDKYGVLIYTVIVEILADVYNFWAKHKVTLWEFFENPVQFILDQIAEPFIDWACGLVADAW